MKVSSKLEETCTTSKNVCKGKSSVNSVNERLFELNKLVMRKYYTPGYWSSTVCFTYSRVSGQCSSGL